MIYFEEGISDVLVVGKTINKKVFISIIVCLITLIVEVLIGLCIQGSDDLYQDVFDLFFVFINTLLVLFIIIYNGIIYKVFANMVLYSFVSFLITAIAYLNADAFIDFFKQSDSYIYHYSAIATINGGGYWYEDTYTRLLAIVYSNFGISYRVAVGVNIVASLLGFLFLYKTLILLKINKKTIIVVMTIFLIMPWRWQLSLFPMREAIPTSLLIISLFNLVKWYEYNAFKYGILSVLLSICSMAFHSGLLFVPMVYIVFIIGYNPLYKKIVVTTKGIFALIMMVSIVGGCVYLFADSIFAKMPSIDFILDDTAVSRYSSRWINDDGGSTYLKWLSYNSILDVFWQSPLRAVYFLLSPVPWEWRGIFDVLAFMSGAAIHVYIYYYFLRYHKYISYNYKVLVKMIILVFVLESLLFGVTTFNAGTAMRHRAKFEVLLFVVWAITMKSKMLKMK